MGRNPQKINARAKVRRGLTSQQSVFNEATLPENAEIDCRQMLLGNAVNWINMKVYKGQEYEKRTILTPC